MKKYFFLGITALVLTSCNIYRDISFNENHGGHMENKIDMSSMMSLMNENGMGSLGSMGGMQDIQQMDMTKKQLEAIAGLSNVTVVFDSTGIITTSYDFANVDALQSAMSSGGADAGTLLRAGSEGGMPKLKVTYKGKKFYLEELNKKDLQKMAKQTKSEEMGQMEMLLNSSTMYTTLTFPSDVKKVSYKNASVTNNRTVSYNMSLKDMYSVKYKPLTITLK